MGSEAVDAADARRMTATVRPVSAADRSDKALAVHARSQHGVLSVGQLQSAGLSPRAVRHRAATGRLTRVHTGIYAVGQPSRAGRSMAAVLACGAGAVLSHQSAAALWGIGEDPGQVHVTVVSRHGRSRPGIVVHRVSDLDVYDLTAWDGLPCTSLARTVLDLAAAVDRRRLERAIDRAETLRIFDLDALNDVLHRNRGRRGTPALASVLASYGGPEISRSEAEERLLATIGAAGLQRPRVNAWIGLSDGGGYEADFLWPDARLIVEVDGRAFHARRRAFEHDRRRDRRLALAGFETRRYSAAELASDPGRVVTEIRAFLSLGRSRP